MHSYRNICIAIEKGNANPLASPRKRKPGAKPRKPRFPCNTGEMAVCLGDDIGQKKQWPQIERNGLFLGIGKGNSLSFREEIGAKKSRHLTATGLNWGKEINPRKRARKTLRKLTRRALCREKARSRLNHLFSRGHPLPTDAVRRKSDNAGTVRPRA